MRAAVEHVGLAEDEVRHEALMAQLGALYHARSLAEIEPKAPWTIAAPPRAPRLYRVPKEFHQAAGELSDESRVGEMFSDTAASLVAWLGLGQEAGVPDERVRVPEDEAHVPPAPDPQQVRAAAEFAEEVHLGEVSSIRTIKRRLRTGQGNAQTVQPYLAGLIENRPVLAEVR